MKALVSIFVLMGSLTAVKAQQLQQAPGNQSPLSTFKFKADTSLNKYFNPDNSTNLNGTSVTPNISAKTLVAINIDHMPVAKLNSDDRMPIVQTDRTGYTMPVVGKSQARVYTMKTNSGIITTIP